MLLSRVLLHFLSLMIHHCNLNTVTTLNIKLIIEKDICNEIHKADIKWKKSKEK